MRKRNFGVASIALVAALGMNAAIAGDDEEFDPRSVDVVDALECRLDPPTYNGFAVTIGSDEEGYASRGWKKLESGNPFLSQYELPEAITVGGRSTRTVVFSSSAIMAVLDGDAAELAKGENIENAMGSSPKFLGERVISSKKEKDFGLSFTSTVKRVLSNVSSHPGKALLGCSYAVEIEE